MYLGAKWWGEADSVWRPLEPGKVTRKPIYSMHAICEVGIISVIFQDRLSCGSGDVIVRTHFCIAADGAIAVDVTMSIDDGIYHVPRAGLMFTLPEGFEQIEWYGRGPRESYCDRTLASPIGLYKSTVEDTHFPFVPPSHNGSHCDTRLLKISNGAHTLSISGAPFSFDIHHNTPEDYFSARHEHELIRRKESCLCIDGAHAGIGGDMAWSTEMRDIHKVFAQELRFGFVMKGE